MLLCVCWVQWWTVAKELMYFTVVFLFHATLYDYSTTPQKELLTLLHLFDSSSYRLLYRLKFYIRRSTFIKYNPLKINLKPHLYSQYVCFKRKRPSYFHTSYILASIHSLPSQHLYVRPMWVVNGLKIGPTWLCLGCLGTKWAWV